MNKRLKNSLIIAVMMFIPVFQGYSMAGMFSRLGRGTLTVGKEVIKGFSQKQAVETINKAGKAGMPSGFATPKPQQSAAQKATSSSVQSQIGTSKVTIPAFEKATPSGMPFGGQTAHTKAAEGIDWSKWGTVSSTSNVSGQKIDVEVQEKAPEVGIEEMKIVTSEPTETAITLVEPSTQEQLVVHATGKDLALSQELANRVESATPNENMQIVQVVDEETGQEKTHSMIDMVKAAQELIAYNKRFIPETDVYRILGLNVTLQPNTEKMIDLRILLNQFEKNMTPQQALALQDAMLQMPLLEGTTSESALLVKSAAQKPAVKIQLLVDMDMIGNIVEQTLLQQEMRPIMPQAQTKKVSTPVLQASESQKLLMPAAEQPLPAVQKEVKPTWKETNRQSVDVEIKPAQVQEQLPVAPVRQAVPSMPMQQKPIAIESGSLSTARLQLPTTSLQDQRRGYFARPIEEAAPKRRGRPPKVRTTSALSLQKTPVLQSAQPIEQAATVQLPTELAIPEQTFVQPQGAPVETSQEVSMQSMQQPETVTTQAEPAEASTQTGQEETRRGRKRGARGTRMAEGEVRAEKRAKTSSGKAGRSGGSTVARVTGRTVSALPVPTVSETSEVPPFGPNVRPSQIEQEIETAPHSMPRLDTQEQVLPPYEQEPQEQPVLEQIQPEEQRIPAQEAPEEQPEQDREGQQEQPEPAQLPQQVPSQPAQEETQQLPEKEEKKEEPKKEKPQPRQIGAPSPIPQKKEKKSKDKKPQSAPSNQDSAPRYVAPEPYQPSYPEYFGDMSGPVRFGPLPPINIAIPKGEKKEPKVNEWQEKSPQENGHTYAALKTAPSMPRSTKQSRAQRAMRFIVPQEQQEIIEEAPMPVSQEYSFGDYVKIVVYVVTGITATLSGAYLIRWLILRGRG